METALTKCSLMNSNLYYTPYAPNADNTVWQLDLELVAGAADMTAMPRTVSRLLASTGGHRFYHWVIGQRRAG